MQIDTKFLGTVDIEKDEIIDFKEGLPGFVNYKQYVLLPLNAEFPLAVLQSIEQPEIGFVVAYPFVFKKDYAFDISDEEKEQLEIEKEEDVIVYSIITLKDSFQDSTLNLLAPVVINMKKKLGKQLVLHDSEAYPLRYPIAIKEGSAK